MKKFVRFMMAIMGAGLLAIPSGAASAASLAVDVTGETGSDSVVLTIKVDDFKEVTGFCKGICGLSAKLDYDDTKVELVSVEGLNNFTLEQGEKIALYKEDVVGVSEGAELAKLEFKNVGLAGGEETTIGLTEVVGTDGDQDVPAADMVRVVKYVEDGGYTEDGEYVETGKLELGAPKTGDGGFETSGAVGVSVAAVAILVVGVVVASVVFMRKRREK